MTHNNFDNILDKCLDMLQNEQVSLDDCLAQFPQYAADLRPLLEMAVEIGRSPHPIATTAAFKSGKQRMLAALAEKKQAQAVSPFSPHRSTQQEQRPFRLKNIFAMRRLFSSALTAATILIVIVGLALGGNFAFQTWRAGEVAQTASLVDIAGVVEVQLSGSVGWQPVVSDTVVKPGDRIRTGSHSSVTLIFFDNSQTSLAADTRISIAELSARRDGGNKKIVMSQWLGQTVNRVERLLDPASRFEIETPTAVTAVRGTVFVVDVAFDGTTEVTVGKGLVEVIAQETTIAVPAGQETTIQPDEPPAPAVPATTPLPAATRQPSATPRPFQSPQATSQSTQTPLPPGYTPTPTYTPRPTHTYTPTPTHTPRPTPTYTPTPTHTPRPTPTYTPTPTHTPKPTYTPMHTHTPMPTYTPTPTYTPKPTYTPMHTHTPMPTYTPTPTRTPMPTHTPKPTKTPMGHG